MKILQFCHKPPLPASDGGCVAMNELTMLLEEHDLMVVCFDTDKHPLLLNKLTTEYRNKTKICGIPIDTRITLPGILKSLVLNKPYNIQRYFSLSAKNQILKMIEQFKPAVIIMDGLYSTVYISDIIKISNAKLVLREHNAEYDLLKQRAFAETNLFKRFYFNVLSNQVKTYEKQILEKVHQVWTISNEDKKKLQTISNKDNLKRVPFTIPIKNVHPELFNPANLKIGYLGALNWFPNREGLLWFVKEVWQEIKQEITQAEFHIAGRDGKDLEYLHQPKLGIYFHGEVSNATEYIEGFNIMVIPVLSGSGIKVKVIEAMSLCRAVIGTEKAFDGIDVTHLNNVYVAKNKTAFAKGIKELLSDATLCKTIAKNGFQFVNANHNRQIVKIDLERLISEENEC